MTRSGKLKPIINVAEILQQGKARRLAATTAIIVKAEQRIDQLRNFDQEYKNRLRQQPTAVQQPEWLQNQTRFFNRLFEAIDLESRFVSEAKQTLERQKMEWLGSRNRTVSLQTLSDNYRADEQKQKQKREQKMLEDFARPGRTKPV